MTKKTKKEQKDIKAKSKINFLLSRLAEDLNFIIKVITTWKKILKIRSKILWILTISFYFMVIFWLFYEKNIISSLIYLLLFFVTFHFFFIEIYKYKLANLFYILFILSIIEIIFFGFNNMYITFSIVILNIWIFILADYLRNETVFKTKFSSWDYFVWWGYLFTVFLTLLYCFTLIWNYKIFPFTCQSLSDNSTRFVDIIAQPFKLWIQEASSIKSNLTNFLENNKLIDLITIWSAIEVTDKTNWSIYWWIVNKFEWYKQLMFDQVIQDKDLVNMWTCDFMLKEIQKRYNNPTFKFSVILLSFLLLYPFLRLATYIVNLIWYIVYNILKVFNIYRKKKVNKEIEEIV